MKKLSIALALILCVVLCVFCFASCGKKKATATTADQGTTPAGTTADQGTTPAGTTVPGTTVPGTTAPVTTEGHVHTPESEYTIDKPATCGADGSKSYHCEECGAIIEGTEVVIPADPTKHVVDDWNVTKEATIFEDGARTGTCTVCHQPIEEVVAETYNEYKFTTESTDKLDKSKNVKSLLGEDKHFYPTEANPSGLDLYVEFSFLWNADLLKMSNVANQVLTGSLDNNDLYWMSLTDNAKGSDGIFAGGFEYTATRTVEYGPAGMSQQTANGNKVGNTYADFPNIGGADKDNPEYGWHRFALVLHEELVNEAALKADTEAKATAAEYLVSVTVYVDGVKLYTLSNRADAAFKASSYKDENLLFKAESDGAGNVVYSDISDSKNVTWIQIPTFTTTEGTAYAVYADEAIFAGSDFAQKVVKVVAPVDNVYTTKDGASIPAKIWYKPYDPNAHDHVYSVEVEVTKEATLLGDGTKVMKCEFCDDTKTVDYAYVPSVRKFTKDTKTSYSPNEVTVGTLRGDKHFYEAGNDLLVEYSFLWNDSILNLRNDKNPFIDTRFTNASGSRGKNVIFWSPNLANSYSECKAAGGFEYGGLDKNEPDNPYPRFNGKYDDITAYPNIGGYNNGDGTPQTNDLYGWHRVSIRYRTEITNKEALMAATEAGVAATYKLQVWVYIDGKLVVHAYQNDLISTEKDKPDEDRKLFTASSDGNGGIAYVENDDLILKPVFLNSNRAKDGTNVYYSIADVNITVGTDFVQNVARINYPVEAQLEVEDGVFVTATMWYTKPCAEHTWDGEFTVIEEPTLVSDGLKVEHCSVCGMSHEVALEAAPVITDSKNLAASPYADNQNKDLAILKNASDIRGEGHFYPESTEVGAQGNDLWFEYSFLYNETLYYRDTPANLAEMRMFAFRSISNPSNYRGFYYIYFRNNNDGFKTSGDCPFAGHIDYSTYLKGCSPDENCADDLTSLGNTLNGRTIGRYAAGWKGKRTDSPYLWDSEWQTMGGWHRLGFRYHQEVASVEGSTVAYAGYTELYIDGVLCWRVHTNVHPTDGDSLMKKGLLLWTATAADGAITGYADNDDVRVGLRLDNLAGSSQNVYVGIDDVQWSMGDGFVHPVVRVENPKPVKYEVAPGVEVDGAMYFAKPDCVHVDEWTVTTAPTLLSDGEKVNYCAKCGEKLGTGVVDSTEPIVYLTNWDAAARAASPYSIDNPDDHKDTFGFKESLSNVKGDDHFYDGKDLLIEFSFLYNETMANASKDGTLTVMYIENNNLFNINMKTGKIDATNRTGDVVLYKADESGKIPIGEYGWHRFAVRIHQDAVNNAGTVEYTVIATAYLDGVKILEVDKTAYALSKHNGGSGYTGLLYTATVENDELVYADNGKHCDVYVMVECIYNNQNDANAGYVVVGDVDITCGADFVQDVQAVADPAAQTFVAAEGVELPAAFYYELK